MKSKIYLLVLAIFGLFVFQSCEETKDALDITEEFDYEHEMPVYSPDSAFSITEVIDFAEQSSEIEKYGDKIKKIEILSIKYSLTTFEGEDDQAIDTASLSVADENGEGKKLIATIENQNLKELLDNETDLSYNNDGVDRLAELIKNPPHKFQLLYNVECNKAPLDFTVKFKFRIKMTANPLD